MLPLDLPDAVAPVGLLPDTLPDPVAPPEVLKLGKTQFADWSNLRASNPLLYRDRIKALRATPDAKWANIIERDVGPSPQATSWGESIGGAIKSAAQQFGSLAEPLVNITAAAELGGRAVLSGLGVPNAQNAGIDYGAEGARREMEREKAQLAAEAADRARRQEGITGVIKQGIEDVGGSFGAVAPIMLAPETAIPLQLGNRAPGVVAPVIQRAAQKLPSWAGGAGKLASPEATQLAAKAVQANAVAGVQSGTQQFQETYQTAVDKGLDHPLARAAADATINTLAESGFGAMQGATGALRWLQRSPLGQHLVHMGVDMAGEGAAEAATGAAQYVSGELAAGRPVTADGLMTAVRRSAVAGVLAPAVTNTLGAIAQPPAAPVTPSILPDTLPEAVPATARALTPAEQNARMVAFETGQAAPVETGQAATAAVPAPEPAGTVTSLPGAQLAPGSVVPNATGEEMTVKGLASGVPGVDAVYTVIDPQGNPVPMHEDAITAYQARFAKPPTPVATAQPAVTPAVAPVTPTTSEQAVSAVPAPVAPPTAQEPVKTTGNKRVLTTPELQGQSVEQLQATIADQNIAKKTKSVARSLLNNRQRLEAAAARKAGRATVLPGAPAPSAPSKPIIAPSVLEQKTTEELQKLQTGDQPLSRETHSAINKLLHRRISTAKEAARVAAKPVITEAPQTSQEAESPAAYWRRHLDTKHGENTAAKVAELDQLNIEKIHDEATKTSLQALRSEYAAKVSKPVEPVATTPVPAAPVAVPEVPVQPTAQSQKTATPEPAQAPAPSAEKTQAPAEVNPRAQAFTAMRHTTGELEGQHKLAGATVVDPDSGATHRITDVSDDGDLILDDGAVTVPFEEAGTWTVRGKRGNEVPLARFISNAKREFTTAAEVKAAAKPRVLTPEQAATPTPARGTPVLPEKAVVPGMENPVSPVATGGKNSKTNLLGGGEILVDGSLESAAVSPEENDRYGVFVGYYPSQGKWIVFGSAENRANDSGAKSPFSILTPLTDVPESAQLRNAAGDVIGVRTGAGEKSDAISKRGEAVRGLNIYSNAKDESGRRAPVGKIDPSPVQGRDLFDTKAEALARAEIEMANRESRNRRVAKATGAVVELTKEQSAERAGEKRSERQQAEVIAKETEAKSGLEQKLAQLHVLDYRNRQSAIYTERRAIQAKYADELAALQEDLRAPQETDRYKAAKKKRLAIDDKVEAEMDAAGLNTELETLAEKLRPFAPELALLDKIYAERNQKSTFRIGGSPTRGGFVFFPWASQGKPKPTVSPGFQLSPETEAQDKANKGLTKDENRWREKLFRLFKNIMGQSIPELHRVEDAWVYDKINRTKTAPVQSLMRAKQTLVLIRSQIPKGKENLFYKAVTLRNIYYDFSVLSHYREDQAQIPIYSKAHGPRAKEMLVKEYGQVMTELAKPENQDVQQALAFRDKLISDEITEPMIAADVLDPTQRGRPWFHQMSKEMHELRHLLPSALSSMAKAGTGEPGMTKARTHSGSEFNTLYEQAELVSFASAYVHQEHQNFENALASKSESQAIVDRAQKLNKDNADVALNDPTKPAARLDGLRALAWWVNTGNSTAGFANHLPILNQLAHAYSQNEAAFVKAANDPKNAVEISQLQADLLGKNGALVDTWLGGTGVPRGNEKYGVLGEDYIDPRKWSNTGGMASVIKLYNSENKTDLQPFHFGKSREFIQVFAMTPEQTLRWQGDILAAQQAKGAPLTDAEIAALRHTVMGAGMQNAITISGEQRPLVLPRRWVDALKNNDKRMTPSSIDALRTWQGIQGRVAGFQLRNPVGVLKWALAQVTSNAQMLMTSNVKAFVHLPRAMKILARVAANKPLSPKDQELYNAALQYNAAKSGMFSTVENMDERQFRETAQMLDDSGASFGTKVLRMAKNAATGNNVPTHMVASMVDDAPKLAVFMQLRDLPIDKIVREGYQWGISSKAKLEAMRDGGSSADEIAAQIARDSTGDYLATSPLGQAMSKNIAPFYRWVEASQKLAVRQLLSTLDPRTMNTAGGVAAKAVRLGMIYGTSGILVDLFNRAAFGDDDAERARKKSRAGALIIRKDPNGELHTISFASVLSDLMGRLGINPMDPTNEVTPGNMVKAYAGSFVSQVGSIPKGVVRATLGQEWNSFQNTFRDAPVSSPAEAAKLALDTVGLRLISNQVDPLMTYKPFSLLDIVSTSQFDQDIDYFAGRKVIADVAQKLYPDEPVGAGAGGKVSDSDMLFRNFLSATKLGDENKAVGFLSQYFAGGKQYNDFASAVRSRGVFNTFSQKQQAAIRAALTPAQTKLVDKAEEAFKAVSQSPLLDRAVKLSMATLDNRLQYQAAKAKAVIDAAERPEAPEALLETQQYMDAKEFTKARDKLLELKSALKKADPENRQDYREAISYVEDYLDSLPKP